MISAQLFVLSTKINIALSIFPYHRVKSRITLAFCTIIRIFASSFPHKNVVIEQLFPHKSVAIEQLFPHKSVEDEENYL